jgi:Asp-tRNA(Asn)/Glu-tRNA(Gln) amidotransferase A subunit family amidase
VRLPVRKQSTVSALKPTVGLVSQDGIIPIAHSQDTAGPMCRTVTDAAIMLNVLKSPFGPVSRSDLPPDYTVFLKRGTLNGARIGVDERYFHRRLRRRTRLSRCGPTRHRCDGKSRGDDRADGYGRSVRE